MADDYLIHSFDRVRALAPDIVVITGDFLTHRRTRGESQYAQLRDVLAHLPHGRLATLGILGNHDYAHGWGDPAIASRVVAEAERAGVRVLRNESQAVAGLDFVGVESGSSFVRASWCDRRLRCSRCAPRCMQRSVRQTTAYLSALLTAPTNELPPAKVDT